MKSRQEFPPGGWGWTQPQIPNWVAPQHQSFDNVVMAIIGLRKGNRFLITEHHLSVDPAAVANELDEYTAQRMLALGYTHFVVDAQAAGAPAAPFHRATRLQRLGNVVAASVHKITAGVGTVMEWVGDGLKTVDGHVADNRACICATCPCNETDPDWMEKLSSSVVSSIKSFIEVKRAMKLKTKYDDQLRFCKGCGCGLETKVWVPIKVIRAKLIPEIKSKLDPRCWQLHEHEEDVNLK